MTDMRQLLTEHKKWNVGCDVVKDFLNMQLNW